MKVKTAVLSLTAGELLQLRDLLSVKPSPTQKESVSQMLASALDRVLPEESLFQKVCNACESLGLPTQDDAPSFCCVLAELPKVSVAMLTDDDEIEEIEFEIDEPEDEPEDEDQDS